MLPVLTLERVRLMAVFSAALTTALVAGFFYAYACSVMLGLDRLDAAGFVRAMQAINATVRNPVFAFGFFGALLSTGAAALGALPQWRRPAAQLILSAFLLYAVGAFGVTMALHVPLNEALAEVSVDGVEALGAGLAPDLEAVRRAYAEPWTRWNAVRAGAATAALLCLCAALYLCGRDASRSLPHPLGPRLGETGSRTARVQRPLFRTSLGLAHATRNSPSGVMSWDQPK